MHVATKHEIRTRLGLARDGIGTADTDIGVSFCLIPVKRLGFTLNLLAFFIAFLFFWSSILFQAHPVTWILGVCHVWENQFK